jgi:hypothetical protein
MAALWYEARSVNDRILRSISRPQYPANCSIAALTAVINYLYGAGGRQNVTQEDFASTIGVDIRTGRGPGNRVLLDWFDTYLKKKKLVGAARLDVEGNDVNNSSPTKDEQIFAHVKKMVDSVDTIYVRHLDDHYNLVCGYFECASRKNEAFSAKRPKNFKRWLIMADHWAGHRPVYSMDWELIQDEMIEMRNENPPARYGLLLFSRVKPLPSRKFRAEEEVSGRRKRRLGKKSPS